MNYIQLPEHLRSEVENYVDRGIEPYSPFLRAILNNDLKGAFSEGTEDDQARIKEYVKFMFNHLPAGCQGSAEHVARWVRMGGLKGIDAPCE